MLENIRVLAAARLSSSNFHLLRSKQDRKDDREAEKLRWHGCIGLHMLHHFLGGKPWRDQSTNCIIRCIAENVVLVSCKGNC